MKIGIAAGAGERPSRPKAVELGFSDVWWDVTQRCWAQDRTLRPSANEIVSTLTSHD